MSRVTREQRIAEYVEDNYDNLVTALTVWAEHMEAAAKEAEAGHQAGQRDQEVLAAQNRSLVTNNGYGQMATIFEDTARQAREHIARLTELVDDED